MYGFGRPLRRLCALVLLPRCACDASAGGNLAVETLHVTDDLLSAENGCFSKPWLEQYGGENSGCGLGRGSYTWREDGCGSNINNLLNAWVYFLAVERWSDMSLISDPGQFRSMTCFNESGGVASHGWGCLFSSMPHLCVFDAAEMKKKCIRRAASLMSALRTRTRDIVNFLQELEVDHLGAMAVMAKYLWSHMAPWLRDDVRAVTRAEKAVQEGLPFLGIHVRRGDKLKYEAHAVAVEEYLKAAVAYVEGEPTLAGVDGIKAMWVASDDPAIVDEVRALAPTYFPSVTSEAIVYVYGKVAGGRAKLDGSTGRSSIFWQTWSSWRRPMSSSARSAPTSRGSSCCCGRASVNHETRASAWTGKRGTQGEGVTFCWRTSELGSRDANTHLLYLCAFCLLPPLAMVCLTRRDSGSVVSVCG